MSIITKLRCLFTRSISKPVPMKLEPKYEAKRKALERVDRVVGAALERVKAEANSVQQAVENGQDKTLAAKELIVGVVRSLEEHRDAHKAR